MKRIGKWIALLALALCLAFCAAGCVHYMPNEEETTPSEDFAPAGEQTDPATGDTNPSTDKVPNQPEDGYTKRY